MKGRNGREARFGPLRRGLPCPFSLTVCWWARYQLTSVPAQNPGTSRSRNSQKS